MSAETKGKTPVNSPPGSPSSKQAAANGFDRFLEGVGTISDSQRELLKFLYDINGQDAYDAEAAALGKLRAEEYLALPAGMHVPTVSPGEVGSPEVRAKFKARDLAAVYVLNKARAPAGENAVVYALIRLEAVKMGWVAGQKEIAFVPFSDYGNAIATLSADLSSADNRDKIEQARAAAYLIPLVAEHTFRTYGHHYLSGQAAEYQQRYRDTLRSCLREDITTLLSAPNLYHHVLHWVSPARAYNVLVAQIRAHKVPDALVIRADAPPAGTALITTTVAVLEAMKSAGIYDEVDEHFPGDLDLVISMAKKIRSDVRKWHKSYFAYGVAGPSQQELEEMEAAKSVAISFAPYAQGFIDGTLQRAALGRARALKKYADLNPIAQQRSIRFFRALGRQAVTSISDLFSHALDVEEATT